MCNDLIDLIYETSFAPELWPEVLDRLSALIDGKRGSLAVFGSGAALWTASTNFDRVAARIIDEGWTQRGRFSERVFGRRHAGFISDLDVFTMEELQEEPLYRDVYRPHGFGWSAGAVFHLTTGEKALLGLYRLFDRGPVEADHLRLLDDIRPHLARCVLIAARLQLERARAISEALALLQTAALVMDDRGKVLVANALIERQESCVRWQARDRVSFADPAADKILVEAIDNFRNRDAVPGRSFPVRDAEGVASRVAHLIPVRRSARDVFVRCAAVMVLTPVAAPDAPPIELVQSLFDLTPAEARVARSLATGAAIDAIAASCNISTNTVRSHVRGILEKTGCNRQAEVVALLAGASGVVRTHF